MGSKEPCKIRQFDVYSADGSRSVSIFGGTPHIEYRESVLTPFVSINTALIDSGNSIADDSRNSRGAISALEALKFEGPSKVLLDIEDAVGNRIRLNQDNSLRLSRSGFIKQGIQNSSAVLNIFSKEYFDNMVVANYVTRHYSGRISDSIRTILSQDLRTTKDIDIDETTNSFSEWGGKRPPFECIMEMQPISIPNIQNSNGNMCGYFFWQTSDGFKYKSLDKLFDSTGRTIKRYLFNNKVDRVPPPGYDDKIIDADIQRITDAEAQMLYGAYNVVVETFDPVQVAYTINEPLVSQGDGNGIIAGRELPNYGEYASQPTSRIITDIAYGNAWNSGDSARRQVEKSRDENFSVTNTLAQSTQNYRQKLNMSANIFIPGDFSLHAGDLIHCDFLQTSSTDTPTISPKDSGIYMILDLCHFITPSKTITGLKIVRDSFGIRNSG